MISYIRDDAGKIKFINADGRAILLVDGMPEGCQFSSTYEIEEIVFAFKVLNLKHDQTQFYAEKIVDEYEERWGENDRYGVAYRLYVGETSYAPFQVTLSAQIFGVIQTYRYLKLGK